METKFRDMFQNSGIATADTGDAPFHKLFNGVIQTGNGVYAVIFAIAIIAALCATSLVFFKLFVANDGKSVNEEKNKLTRNLILVFFIVILGSLATVMYNAFLW